jgi:hypothetical protein
MKRLLIVLAVFLISTPAMAGVMLTWDESPVVYGVDVYQVEIDGQVIADVAPNSYALVSVEAGQHTARVRAHNMWGWSGFSTPVDFTVTVPSAPLNVRLEAK